MKNLQIYDNGGESLDRYTIFKARQRGYFDRHGTKVFPCIAASRTGLGVYLHIDACKESHLGKRIKFEDLDVELQKRLRNEFES